MYSDLHAIVLQACMADKKYCTVLGFGILSGSALLLPCFYNQVGGDGTLSLNLETVSAFKFGESSYLSFVHSFM